MPNNPITFPEPIAIIGIGCVFPGACGPDAFWQLLRHERDAVQEIPPERFDIDCYHDPTPGTVGKIVARRGGFIENVDLFDAGFFGISAREAESMDPQQRLLLEVAWEAVEDAGLTRAQLSNSVTGVFIGMSSSDYSDMQLQIHDSSIMDVYTLPGTARSILAGRISHILDLKGPSIAVDTACSSSLVAAHLACQSLWRGECGLALAGGVNVILTPEGWAVLSLARIISPDGRAKVFDARANGFVRGEGAGIAVLKPLAQAQADGDPIYAVIRGSAVNNDGHNSSVLTPNQQAQEAVLRAAYRHAGISPGQVHYVEAHGTGTSVGDPIEARALGTVMAEGRAPGAPCLIGSVKTNIGHLEAAAGIAGLIKVALCLKHRAVPPSLHFEIPNPAVPWSELPLAVQQKYGEWPVAAGPALAGVSSFGISGTNVHMVLSGAPSAPSSQRQPVANGACLLPLSAHTPEALAEMAARFHDFLSAEQNGHSLPDICYSASVRRTHHAYRLTFVSSSRQELAEQLASHCHSAPSGTASVIPRDLYSGPVFVFSGQGARFWPVDAGLLTRFPVFQEVMLCCEDLLHAQGADWSLLEQLTANNGHCRLHETDVCQVAIFACQVALAALWRSWGIEPSAVIGHSLGEVAAAHVAGVITLDQAVKIVSQRGRITKRASGKGAMALVGLPMTAAAETIQRFETALAVAVSNSPTTCVLSGDPTALAEALEELERRNVWVRRLPAVDYAAHSSQMEPLKHELALALAGLTPRRAALPFYSTVTTTAIDGADLDAGYWADNLREPVRFDQTLQNVLVDGHRCFLEVHPTQVLLHPIQEGLAHGGWDGAVYPSLQRDADGASGLLRSLGNLYTHGYPVRWESLYPTGGSHVSLPMTPWQRRRYWLSAAHEPGAHTPRPMTGERGRHPLLGLRIQSAAQPDTYIMQTELGCDRPSYLADHRVYDAAVLPAVAYVEMALAIAQEIKQPGKPTLTDLAFEKALVLPEKGTVPIQVSATVAKGTISLEYYSRLNSGDGASWIQHAKATVRLNDAASQQPLVQGPSPAAFQGEAEATISRPEHYQTMASHGLNYGPSFQGIGQLWLRGTEVLAELDLPELVVADASKYQIHPALLDAAFQTVAAILHSAAMQRTNRTFLPVALKTFCIHQPAQQAAYAHVVVHPPQDGANQRVAADVYLLDREGRILAEAQELILQQFTDKLSDQVAALDQCLYQVAWQPQPLPQSDVSLLDKAGRWLILGDTDGLGGAVAEQLRRENVEFLWVAPHQEGQNQIDLESPDSVRQLIAGLSERDKPLHAILYLAAVDAATQEEVGAPTGQVALIGLLHLVQALSQHGETLSPRLWIVTRSAQPVTEADAIALDQTSLWGLARTIAIEHPKLRCSIIDLGAHSKPEDAKHFFEEVLADGLENQVAYRGEERWVARLARYAQASANTKRPAVPGEAFRLEMTAPGILDNLILAATERIPPEPDEVEIRMHSAGLNFLDVLSALGLRPDQTGADLILGMECAGTVTQVGKNVSNVQVGDEVLAVAPHSIGAYARTLAGLVTLKPADLSFQEAATVPIAYLTAYYALHTLGRLGAGERILIHSAAGGVGLAAVHLAQRAGAEIYATAGSPEKRAFLRELGIDAVMDSRSLDFADEVMAYTNGDGVDLVLNSLAGEAIPKSLAILRANGRFLEIGKRDIYGRSKLDMGLLKKNIAFFAIDLIPLMTKQPAFCAELLGELTRMLADGSLPPLPYIEFPIARAEQAFRYMAQAKHIGKIVIRADVAEDDTPLQITPRSRATLRRHGTYLITGGLGGLGLCVARWLVGRGARHLVLLSRGEPSPEARKVLTVLEAEGAEVVTVQADVSQATEVDAVLQRIETSMPPLRGLFHAAGVLDDGLLLQMNEARFQRVMAPKVSGAWVLHQLTSHLELDLFVLFSSATAILGSPGQGNYTAANAFLDGLAHYRHRQGLPALSINWGAWAEVGMAAQLMRAAHLAQQGILPFTPQQGVQMLESILATSVVQVTAIDVDWPRMLQRFSLPLLQALAAEVTATSSAGTTRTSDGLRKHLQSLAPAEQRAAIADLLQKQLAHVLRTPIHQLGSHQPLSELGIDSLMTVELVNRIEADLGLTLPMSTLLQSPTLSNLTELVAKLLEPPAAVAGQTQASRNEDLVPDDHLALHVADLADEAILAPSIQFTAASAGARAAPCHLFLTGATGFVGTFLLYDLLQKTDARIYCLVRAADPDSGRQRIIQALEHSFPAESMALNRIVAIPGDLAQPELGLSPSEFDQLAEQIDLIIHSGAQINWLAPYARLKPVNVLGTQTIIQLAAHHRLKPLHYVSSLAVFPMMGNIEPATFDEQASLEHGGLLYGGYAQSKWVAEKLVTSAQERGLPGAIYRPSLVVGHSQTGAWQGDNVIANMLRSWIELGMAPDLEAQLDLTPVNYVSQAVVSLALCSGAETSGIYHLNNLCTVTVGDLIDWLIACGYVIHRMPYRAWRDEMLRRGDVRRQAIVDAVGPLLALPISEDVEWLERIPRFSNRLTQQSLGDLTCPPVDAAMFRTYVEYLKQRGALPTFF